MKMLSTDVIYISQTRLATSIVVQNRKIQKADYVTFFFELLVEANTYYRPGTRSSSLCNSS
jgi:hypothetical protein